MRWSAAPFPALSSSLLLVLPTLAAAAADAGGGGRCDTLKTALKYAQDKAPRDISAVLPVIVEKVNRELSGVVDVEVGWTGGESFHSRVGDHTVRCSVTRLVSAIGPDAGASSSPEDDQVSVDEEGRRIVTQCFDVPFVILDTDECTLPVGHHMRHKCADPSVCVNTIGSYECVCPSASSGGGGLLPALEDGKAAAAGENFFARLEESRKGDPWSTSLNSSSASSCPGKASTYGGCDSSGHSPEGSSCRSSFRCAVDPCSSSGGNDCASSARCVRKPSPLSRPDHECRCPQGLLGNGRKCRKGVDVKPRPAVEFDGVTPTKETLRNDYYCGCTKPVVDACAGFPTCEGKHEVCAVTPSGAPACRCKVGFVRAPGYGCVDESPPVLKLRNDPSDGDGITALRQGDVYREHAVEIADDNAEEYLRSLKITYSRPLPPGCLAKTGRFYVNYTVATPWTSPPYVRVTRTVIIEDVDECSLDPAEYESRCPELVPRCDVEAGAQCVNTRGSYSCRCPEYTTGDGFLPMEGAQKDERGRYINTPEGYAGGKGCRDTSAPHVELTGPNPKVFRVCKCGGLNGVMGGPNSDDDDEAGQKLCDDQRSTYGKDIAAMISNTAGAELCATHTNPNPAGGDCAIASDRTYKGEVDLTSRVKIGTPVQKSDLRWSVPYDVSDDAGNQAKTAWREVIVEEVELADLERRVRDEVLADRERSVKEAVAAAVREERKKAAKATAKERKKTGSKECPPCPECSCPDAAAGGLSGDQCDAKCDERLSRSADSCPVPPANAARATKAAAAKGAIPNESAHPFLQSAVTLAEGILSPSAVMTLLVLSVLFTLIVVLGRLYAWLFYPRDAYYYTRDDEDRERALMNAVTYYNSPASGRHQGGTAATPGSAPAGTVPPRASMSANAYGGNAAGNGIFSPQENRVYGRQPGRMFGASPPPGASVQQSPGENGVGGGGGIYAARSPITPSRSDGTPAAAVGAVGGLGMGSPSPGDERSTPYNLRRRY